MNSFFEGVWLGGTHLKEAEAVIVPWVYHGPEGGIWSRTETQATLEHAVRGVHLEEMRVGTNVYNMDTYITILAT